MFLTEDDLTRVMDLGILEQLFAEGRMIPDRMLISESWLSQRGR